MADKKSSYLEEQLEAVMKKRVSPTASFFKERPLNS